MRDEEEAMARLVGGLAKTVSDLARATRAARVHASLAPHPYIVCEMLYPFALPVYPFALPVYPFALPVHPFALPYYRFALPVYSFALPV